jgi:cobalamin biosynthetic protein CobC
MPAAWLAGPGMPHGGMLDAAARRWPNAPRPFLDLSTGINPVPYPMPALPPEIFSRLPGAEQLDQLAAVAAETYGVADPAMVVPAPGTQILISLLPHLTPGDGEVAVLSPTYGEHEAAWTAAGCRVRQVNSLAACADAAIVVVCNPNNPNGSRLAARDLMATADALARRGGLLVVDEAFADLEPDPGLAPHLPHPALLILRSFGKTYGLAGVRLGFALTDPVRAAALARALGPWPVSGPAIAAGCVALADAPWRQTAITRLDADATRLDAALARLGMALVGGTRLFRLYDGQAATLLADRLGASGILVRAFAGRTSWLRLGLPADAAAWSRLDTALAAIRSRSASTTTRPAC